MCLFKCVTIAQYVLSSANVMLMPVRYVNNSQSYRVKCVLTGNEGRASESSGGVIVDLQQNNSKQPSNFHCKSVYRQLGLQAFHRLSFLTGINPFSHVSHMVLLHSPYQFLRVFCCETQFMDKSVLSAIRPIEKLCNV